MKITRINIGRVDYGLPDFYFIFLDDGSVYVQRTVPDTKGSPPLSDEEIVIIGLVQHIITADAGK